jgi:hypothetical protein
MRRIALLAAGLIASAALIIFLVPARASPLTAGGLHEGGASGANHPDGVLLVRRGGGGFRGGGFRGGRAFHGGFRGGPAFHGGFRGGRAYGFRGGPRYGWHGRRGWRRPGWGLALGAGALAAPYYYGGYNCPLVRRVVRTPYGLRERWVRRCY